MKTFHDFSPARQHVIEVFIYIIIICMLLLVIAVPLLYLRGSISKLWIYYYRTYLLLALAQTWLTYILLFMQDIVRGGYKRYPAYEGEKIAVVIPVFNEDYEQFIETLVAVIQAEGNKDIMVVDDGSSDKRIKETLRALADKGLIRAGCMSRNSGKRNALEALIRNFVDSHDFVVTLDSDTIIDRGALIRLVEPLKIKNIGAVTGDIQLLNENQNLLTKMAGAYYWVALSIGRKSLSALGAVDCCSGALSAYRADSLKLVMDQFVNQKFLGIPATYSDDRHLTNLMLKSGYNVVFVPEAIAYTYTPLKLKQFLRQQLRWRRGFFQEAIFALTYAWKMKPFLFLFISICEIILPLASIGMLSLAVVYTFMWPPFFLYAFIPALISTMILKNMPLILQSSKRIPGLISYTLFGCLIMPALTIYALLTLRNNSWSTR